MKNEIQFIFEDEETSMLKKVALVAALMSAGLAQAFAPQAGTWVVDAENNGQPGRGFGLDVQNSTLVMQMYAYESNGNPTFYLSAGQYKNNAYSGQLNQYRGGRYLGSGDRNGAEAGSAGTVSMRFTSGTTGFITFPGEQEKAISRFSFAYAKDAASLRGIWMFSPLNSLTPTSDFVQLQTVTSATSSGNGMVISTDGTFGCENQTSGELKGTVLCVRVSSSGTLLRAYQMIYSVNDGEGIYVNGTGSSSSSAVMRRLANTSMEGTGPILKNAEEQEVSEANVLNLQEQLSAFAATLIKN